MLYGDCHMKKVSLVVAVMLFCSQELFCADESGAILLDDRDQALFILGQELMSNSIINSAEDSEVFFIPNDREWDLINSFLDSCDYEKTINNMVVACEHAIFEFYRRIEEFKH